MGYLRLSKKTKKIDSYRLKIMIFTEGTILRPVNIFQYFNHSTYLPINNAVNVIKSWHEQGADVIYCTSSRRPKEIKKIKENMLKLGFEGTQLYYRSSNQKYRDIIESVMPNVLIEDDCKSIGGKWQMCITYVKPELKIKIKSIIVREFRGIDHLPLELPRLI